MPISSKLANQHISYYCIFYGLCLVKSFKNSMGMHISLKIMHELSGIYTLYRSLWK